MLALDVPFDAGSVDEINVLRKLLAGRGNLAILPVNDIRAIQQYEEFRGKLEVLPAPLPGTKRNGTENRVKGHANQLAKINQLG